MESGRSGAYRAISFRTTPAARGPLVTSNETSKLNPEGISSNRTIGIRALAIREIWRGAGRHGK